MALLDVVNLDEAQSFLGRKGPTGADRLQLYITAVSRRLDDACGAIVQRAVTELLDGSGATQLWLRHPAAAFTSVTEYQGTTAVTLTRETPGTMPTAGYYADPHKPDPALFSGRLTRRASGVDYWWYGWAGRGNVSVVYTAGRYATTEAVAPHFKEAALVMLRNLVGADEPSVATTGQYDTPGGRFPTFAVPNFVRQMLRDEWRAVPGWR